jgi:hypothetical protein
MRHDEGKYQCVDDWVGTTPNTMQGLASNSIRYNFTQHVTASKLGDSTECCLKKAARLDVGAGRSIAWQQLI